MNIHPATLSRNSEPYPFLVQVEQVCMSTTFENQFYALFWRLTAQDRRLAIASNVGSVKYKAQTAN